MQRVVTLGGIIVLAVLTLGGCSGESSTGGSGTQGTNEPGVLPPPNNMPVEGGAKETEESDDSDTGN